MPMPSHLDLESNEEINNAAGIVGGGDGDGNHPPLCSLASHFI